MRLFSNQTLTKTQQLALFFFFLHETFGILSTFKHPRNNPDSEICEAL